METGPLRSGKDTWVGSGKPNKNHNEANRLRLKSGEGLAFLHTKNPVPNQQTTVEATYTVYAAGPASEWAGTKTLTLRRTADRKPFGRMTWDNKPGVTGSAVSVTVTDAQVGDAITFTVTQHIETSKDGPWYGWRLETDSTTFHKVYGYESDHPPTLEVTYAISPTQPVDLSPSGGAVSKQFPTFTFDAVDLENPNDMTALEIEISTGSAMDSDGSFTTTEFVTGEVPSSSPIWDSTGSLWAGISAGATRYWIARYKSGDGKWGPWSDPAKINRANKGTVTITNPAAEPNNFVSEATPPFIHSFSGTQVAWRKFITLASDRTEVVANSGKQDGTDTSWTPPKKRIQDGETYVIHTWVWDNVARVASPGDPVMAKASREFTFNHDATINAPVMVSAEQDGGTPFVLVTVTRATAPDSWTLLMDGEVVDADIDPADTLTSGTTHVIPFSGATPHDAHTFEVRAVVGGKASPKSAAANLTTKPKGVWLLDYDRERYVHLFETGVDNWRRTDQMGVYQTVGGKPVQVYAGSNGISGSFEGRIGTVEDRNRKAWLKDFNWMAERPMRTYQLVATDLSIPVKIRNASATPHPESIEGHLYNTAYFEFFEVDD